MKSRSIKVSIMRFYVPDMENMNAWESPRAEKITPSTERISK